jgi:coenzyme Q-binding protein COQ10
MKALRPPRLPPLTRLTPLRQPPLPPHRTFVPNPFATTSPQLLTATRTLPYPSAAIYNIIADVPQYSSFLPYCQASTVTRWSAPDRTTHTRWPSEARLVVGWAGITEAFRSRIYCVPGRVVEAVGGASRTTLAEEDIAHHRVTAAVGAAGAETGTGARVKEQEQEQEQEQEEAARTELLTHLLTRWTVRPLPCTPPSPTTTTAAEAGAQGETVRSKEQTEVSLAIEFQFANPIYGTLSAGAAPKVAEMMIRAFEERVKSVLEGRLDEGKSGPELGGTSRRG